jgi:hypothetical protein
LSVGISPSSFRWTDHGRTAQRDRPEADELPSSHCELLHIALPNAPLY